MEDAVLVDIVDDGAGFDVGAVGGARTDGTGFGLLSVRERVQALGGEFRVESAPGAGTAVAVRLPAGDPDVGGRDAGGSDAGAPNVDGPDTADGDGAAADGAAADVDAAGEGP